MCIPDANIYPFNTFLLMIAKSGKIIPICIINRPSKKIIFHYNFVGVHGIPLSVPKKLSNEVRIFLRISLKFYRRNEFPKIRPALSVVVIQPATVPLLNRSRNIRIWGLECGKWPRSSSRGNNANIMPFCHSSTSSRQIWKTIRKINWSRRKIIFQQYLGWVYGTPLNVAVKPSKGARSFP